MTEAKIKIQNLYKIFGRRPSVMLESVKSGISKSELLDKHKHVLGLNDINIEVPAREVSVIMGLSGSGKSTLIRHINRLIEPTSGRVEVDGVDVLSMNKRDLMEFRRRKASMVFQKFGLHVHKTVAENVAYGLIIQGESLENGKKKSAKWLERVGLSGFENHYPSQLSGGMQQRVGLARALATDAEILLMDEAFSALDPLIRTDMQDVMLSLQQELHKTIVFITHDLDEALRIGDSIAILRDGAVIQQGLPQDIIINPADEYIFDFIKDINRGRVLQVGTLMTPGHSVEGPAISSKMVLQDALQAVSNAETEAANVTNQDGRNMGSITMRQIVAGLARPAVESNDEIRYT